jgi:DNA-binding beta-propeller fold protein YncE
LRLRAGRYALFASILTSALAAAAEPQAFELPTGKAITPMAARGAIFQDLNPAQPAAPEMRAGYAAAVAASPDGRLLAISTSGFDIYYGSDGKPSPGLSTEFVFVFDISGPEPRQLQALAVPNAFQGLAWSPTSDRIFASGGKDDSVLEFLREGLHFTAGRVFRLGHKAGVGIDSRPVVAGLAVSPDGTRLLVANVQNDSVSLIDLDSGTVVAEQDLRPGIIDPTHHGEPGGSFPRSVAWTSSEHAYVGSERDREIISLAISGQKMQVVGRLPVPGQPVALATNRAGSRLYAALDITDRVVAIDTHDDTQIEALDAAAPPSLYANKKKPGGGANTNALTLSPDGRTLLVSNGGENAVAVIRLSDRASGLLSNPQKDRDGDGDDDDKPVEDHSAVIGLVPTGWYPAGVAVAANGSKWYVVNGKSQSGANGRWSDATKADAKTRATLGPDVSERNGFVRLIQENQYIHQLERAGFLTLPAPDPRELARLTQQVAHNNHLDRPSETARDKELFSFLHAHIKHVIYIIKENRSYDQVLGDLEIGNGDPHLTLFPRPITPNHHAIARQFVTLDNFMVSGEVSWTGWDWSVAAQTSDFREREEPLTMSDLLKGEHSALQPALGLNRNLNMGFATSEERHADFPLAPTDPDILPGARDLYAPDSPQAQEGRGYLWDSALAAGLSVRNWGFYGDDRNSLQAVLPGSAVPMIRDPYAEKTRVFFPTKTSLMPYSDPYYHDFDPAFPDFWRVHEWKREFAGFVEQKTAPNLMLIKLVTDHFGGFSRGIDGINTVETQMADNDYAIGLILEAVVSSPFAKDTLVITVEDDACDGPDHVDAHRSLVFFAGPYVRQHALVSKRYTTVSLVKTIEEILGLEPIGLNDSFAEPMSDVFDAKVTAWTYKPVVPDILRTTQLPLPPGKQACISTPKRSSEYWAEAMAGQDFSGADRIDAPSFNRALWRGLKGDEPYPTAITGLDLRVDRSILLRRFHVIQENCNDN